MSKTKMRIQVDPSSIIRNITNFFGNEMAFVSELLQNCRRAEASDVGITIDFKTKEFIVEDNGHGVMDPQALITIGKSDWSSKTVLEMPAGMGLFSSFKIGQRLTIYSGNWCMDIDFSKRTLDDAVTLEYGKPRRSGTKVIIHFDTKKLLSSTQPKNAYHPSNDDDADMVGIQLLSFVSAVKRAAEVMPFDTTITIKNPPKHNGDVAACTKLPAFDPNHLPIVAQAKTAWGRVYFVTKTGRLFSPDNKNDGFFLSQGVRFPLSALATELDLAVPRTHYWDGSGLGLVIVADAGTVDFSLPDRDTILKNDKVTRVIKDTKQAMFDALVSSLKEHVKAGGGFPDAGTQPYQALTMFARLFGDRRDELPEVLRFVLTTALFPVQLSDDEFVMEQPRHSIKFGAVECLTDYSDLDIRTLRSSYSTSLTSHCWTPQISEEQWATTFFPTAFFIRAIELDVQNDPRSPHLAQVVGGRLRSTKDKDYALTVELNKRKAYFMVDGPTVRPFEDKDTLAKGVFLQAANDQVDSNAVSEDHLLLHTYELDEAITDDVDFENDEYIRHCTEADLDDNSGEDIAWYSSPAYLAIMDTRGSFPSCHRSIDELIEIVAHKLKNLHIVRMENTMLDFTPVSRTFRVCSADIVAQPHRHARTFPMLIGNGIVLNSPKDVVRAHVQLVEDNNKQLEFGEITVIPGPIEETKKEDADADCAQEIKEVHG